MNNSELLNKKEKIDAILVDKRWDKNYWTSKVKTAKWDTPNLRNPFEANLEDTQLEIEALELLRDSIDTALKLEANPF